MSGTAKYFSPLPFRRFVDSGVSAAAASTSAPVQGHANADSNDDRFLIHEQMPSIPLRSRRSCPPIEITLNARPITSVESLMANLERKQPPMLKNPVIVCNIGVHILKSLMLAVCDVFNAGGKKELVEAHEVDAFTDAGLIFSEMLESYAMSDDLGRIDHEAMQRSGLVATTAIAALIPREVLTLMELMAAFTNVVDRLQTHGFMSDVEGREKKSKLANFSDYLKTNLGGAGSDLYTDTVEHADKSFFQRSLINEYHFRKISLRLDKFLREVAKLGNPTTKYKGIREVMLQAQAASGRYDEYFIACDLERSASALFFVATKLDMAEKMMREELLTARLQAFLK